ncbi:hypothetical protein Ddye_011421 [Dipteronia dyeriana]|uniref:NB-ARC domain-containing protein n=1 Tax=Dipteronia dyeriana TaxID=168575 RepID=A0AAE0CGY0_9ROSI|nr:hypothetical protein Ddye_011421 [Dipteronia dyeriana]
MYGKFSSRIVGSSYLPLWESISGPYIYCLISAAENEVAELQKLKDEETQKLCLGGYCSTNCKSSYNFGKKVHKMLQVVTTLMTEGDFENVAEKIPEAPVDEIPIDPTIVGLQSTFDKVWICLGDQQAGVIGLYGMGGVGKTTLLTQVNNKFLDTPNDVFDVVIWAVVSKDQKLEMIQETIGKKISLWDDSWKTRRLEEKALDIFKVLSQKRFVLLLDDVWERIDLIKVGVPPLMYRRGLTEAPETEKWEGVKRMSFT